MHVVPFGVVCDTDKMTCYLGFSLSTGVLLTTIFQLPGKKILESRRDSCGPRKAALVGGLTIPTACGKRATGQMTPGSRVLEDSSKGILRSRWRKIKRILHMPNTASGISGSAEQLNVSANITVTVDQEENQTMCVWEIARHQLQLLGPLDQSNA